MMAAIDHLVGVLQTHNIECTGPGEVTCRGCRDRSWMSWHEYRVHVAEAVLAAGFIQIVDETDRQYHFDANEHENVWADHPDPIPPVEIGGGEDVRHRRVGVVTENRAGGTVSDLPCKYCGVTGAHTADCPVIS